MHEQIKKRLEDLQQEYKSGEVMLKQLQQQEADLRKTLERIAGAIAVLEELLEDDKTVK